MYVLNIRVISAEFLQMHRSSVVLWPGHYREISHHKHSTFVLVYIQYTADLLNVEYLLPSVSQKYFKTKLVAFPSV